MFDPTDIARVFALPPGSDFPLHLVQGLNERLTDKPPEHAGRVMLFVNTRRMARRIESMLTASGARFLPRLQLVTEAGALEASCKLPPPVSPLQRRLELLQLVRKLLQANPDLAIRSAAFALADSLAVLIEEMQGEGISPEVLAGLDVSTHADHWQRSLAFLNLVQRYFGPQAALQPDSQARQRLATEALITSWQTKPPQHPVIVAGSTGSRGTTARLMQAVARLPQGALVLPGYDFDMPASGWAALSDALNAEDHPQYRYRALLDRLDLTPQEVQPWIARAEAPHPARNRLVSLALRPAPVTDQWLAEGRDLTDLDLACAEMSLIEAPSPRAEALAIALRLRKAAQDGQPAALVTPDRNLARQVTAALDRWRLIPDDSGGRPLFLSAPGRLLRQITGLVGQRITAAALIALLKHPLVHSATGRGDHLLHTRDLELDLRRRGPAFPDRDSLIVWAGRGGSDREVWALWLSSWLAQLAEDSEAQLSDHASRHLRLAEALAAGAQGTDSGELWLKEAGQEAHRAMTELQSEARHGGSLSPGEYADLFDTLLQGREVRESVQAHPSIMIWGTLEARVQGAELVILGGLNEGVWPKLPMPDSWLNRQMRQQAGLLLPERQIGLAAHDFQQAVGAPEVVLSRALRDAESATVPARWLNRLTNLLQGLTHQGGQAQLAAMRARGRYWLDTAAALEADFARQPPVPRPSPRPPVVARPRRLSVTAVEKLIRDPYAIYAQYILGLRPLDPLHPSADALLRGQVLHRIVERFVAGFGSESPHQARVRLLRIAEECLLSDVPWPAARRLWLARLARVADWLVRIEAARPGRPLLLEKRAQFRLVEPDFILTAQPDRIDELPDGRLEIMDYKTGDPPSRDQQAHFAKQLLLEAVMAEHGAFTGDTPREVACIRYIGLGAKPKEIATEIDADATATTLSEFRALLARYDTLEQGYTARRAVALVRHGGDYDHLARLGEWAISDPAFPEDVGTAP